MCLKNKFFNFLKSFVNLNLFGDFFFEQTNNTIVRIDHDTVNTEMPNYSIANFEFSIN